MNKTLLSLGLGLILISAVSDTDLKPYKTQTFDADNISKINVKTSGGSIKVIGGHKDFKVETYITGNGTANLSESEIEERLKNYTISVGTSGSKLICEAIKKDNNNWKKSLNISFKIYSPKNEDIELRTSGGSISLDNLDGRLKFSTSGGGLKLKNLSGNIEGTTSGGGIKCSNCKENVTLTTSGGGINLDQISGKVNVSTSGGSITIEDGRGQLSAKTSGGGVSIINFKGVLNTGSSGGSLKLNQVSGSIDAHTSGGGITARVSDIDDYLKLSTSAGSIDVSLPNEGMDLDLRGNRVSHNFSKGFDGENTKSRVKGTLYGGGPAVKISSSGGSVRVN